MNWVQFFTLYAVSVPVFLLIDMLWLGLVARNFYQTQLGELMQIRWDAAILFYFVFLLGATYFAMYPALGTGWKTAVLLGALFGFFTYATYDLTNLATVRDWPILLVIVDIVWGTVLGATVAGCTVALVQWFGM